MPRSSLALQSKRPLVRSIPAELGHLPTKFIWSFWASAIKTHQNIRGAKHWYSLNLQWKFLFQLVQWQMDLDVFCLPLLPTCPAVEKNWDCAPGPAMVAIGTKMFKLAIRMLKIPGICPEILGLRIYSTALCSLRWCFYGSVMNNYGIKCDRKLTVLRCAFVRQRSWDLQKSINVQRWRM